jgi:dipeptidyl-peptidase-4
MRLFLLFLCGAGALLAQKKPVTLDALDAISRLTPQGPGNPLAWAPTGDKWIFRQARRLMVYDAPSRASRELVDASAMDAAAVKHSAAGRPLDWENRRVRESSVQWSSNGAEILYSAGDLFLIQAADGTWTQLTRTPAPERDPKLSPDGKSVAFRREWDLYVMDLASRKERRLTSGGSETLRNGGLDWVYPEELDLGTAYWWSPDSRSIAYLQFDVSREPLYPHADLRGAEPVHEPQRYPKAGQPNPDVRLGVVNATGGKTRWLDVGDTRTQYLIARVTWAPDSTRLFVIRPNRIQNHVDLLAVGVESRRVTTLLEESDPHWVNLPEEPLFVNSGAQFLWLSERDGFRHIYLYSAGGALLRQLTKGSFEITGIAGVDEQAERVYYTSNEASPLERHIYSINLDGRNRRQLSSGAGTHSIGLGPGAKFYLHTYSSVSAPPRTTLHAGDGTELGVYRDADQRVAGEYEILPAELVTYAGPGGTPLYGRLIKPAGFEPGRQYPAVVFVYGGPGAQGVRNVWTGADLDQALAHAGFVVWQTDNRGSAGRGHAFETPVFRRLGEVELADQIAGVTYLISLGFVDPSRVGIRGWSYGGFMTLNALLHAPDLFRAGVAGAPVTDWRNYDTIYTERYMGLPAENAEAYQNSALPRSAGNLKGSLLIVHNLEDDNVLFQNSVQMIAALERAGKQFETLLYTQKTHAVTGEETRHLNAAMLDFFARKLKPGK